MKTAFKLRPHCQKKGTCSYKNVHAVKKKKLTATEKHVSTFLFSEPPGDGSHQEFAKISRTPCPASLIVTP